MSAQGRCPHTARPRRRRPRHEQCNAKIYATGPYRERFTPARVGLSNRAITMPRRCCANKLPAWFLTIPIALPGARQDAAAMPSIGRAYGRPGAAALLMCLQRAAILTDRRARALDRAGV